MIYRGHRSFDWELRSTLERALQEHAQRWDQHKYRAMTSMAADPETDQWAQAVESNLMQPFRRNGGRFDIPGLPEAWDILGWWEVMQHHGTPTRLMDWSRSPFAAMWFALDHHDDGSGDMALWIYDRRNGTLNHGEALARLRRTEDYELLNDRQVQNMPAKFAIEDGNPALIPVRPRQFPRAVAQQSVLSVSPGIGVARQANWWIREKLATRIRLREEWKPEMKAACLSMGLSRPSLTRRITNGSAQSR